MSGRITLNQREVISAVSTVTNQPEYLTSTSGRLNVNASVTLAGSPIPITGATTALVTAIVDGSGNQITSFGGGTQYAELVTTSPATGTVALGRYKTSPPVLTDGQLYAPQLDVSGNLKTSIFSDGVISIVNSTATNLAGGAVFTGTGEDVSDYSAIQVSIFSSHASATDGLSLQQSSNNTNWDIVDTYTITATTGKIFSIQPAAQYFRLVYTNGATLTTSLRIQVVYHVIAPNPSSQKSADAYTNETDLTQSWSFNSLYNGTTWDRMRGDITNGLDVDVTRVGGDVTVIGKAADGAAVAGNPVRVAGSDGTNTRSLLTDASGRVQIATIATSITPGTAAANLGKAEDAAHVSGDTGVAVWGVRNDTLSTTFGANGDYYPLATTSRGAVYITANTAADMPVTVGAALPAGNNNIGDVDIASLPVAFDTGATSATTQRVIAATNSPEVTALNDMNTGSSTINATSSDGGTALTSTAQVIKASAGKLLGYYIYNPNATAQFVQFYNTAAASVTVGTTNPLFMLTIPATSAANLWTGEDGPNFSNAGWSWAATSTAGGNGAPGTSLDAVAWFK